MQRKDLSIKGVYS